MWKLLQQNKTSFHGCTYRCISLPVIKPLIGLSWKNWESCLARSSPVIFQAAGPEDKKGDISKCLNLYWIYQTWEISVNVVICTEYINNGRSPMSRLCTENAYNGLNIFFSFHDTIYSKTITLFTWMFKLKRIRILEGCINSTCTSLIHYLFSNAFYFWLF